MAGTADEDSGATHCRSPEITFKGVYNVDGPILESYTKLLVAVQGVSMQTISTLTLLMISMQASASCPFLTGTYLTSDKSVIRLEQEDCARLAITRGERFEDGQIEFNEARTQVYGLIPLRPYCWFNSCTEARVSSDSIIFTHNRSHPVNSGDHGLCSYQKHDYTKLSNGDLQVSYSVLECEDGYVGVLYKNYPHIDHF